MQKNLVDRDPFSNGTEYMFWIGRNCDHCWKGDRCRHFREIHLRMGCDDPIHQDTIDFTQMNDCPKREEHRPRKPVKRHRPIAGQLDLPFQD